MQRRYLILIMMLSAACGSSTEKAPPAEQHGPVVAVVGGEEIYARDFVLNYEMGFPHLRRGEDPRTAYLQHMIDEKLLALEGYRQGLDREEEIGRRIEDLREELLVEQVFERYVNDRVEVSEQEIQSALQKDRVSFKLRYVPAATLEQAQTLRSRALRVGFNRVAEDFASENEELSIRSEDLESPYVTWRDVNPAIVVAVEDLPVGEISQPVRYHGSYLLLQVLDVRREPVGPAIDADERTRYEHVLFQQKARSRAREFIGSMMKPRNVRLKPGPYVTLRNNLWNWHQEEPPQQNLLRALEDVDAAYGDSIRSVLDEIMITSSDGEWTVRDFLREYPIERYPLRYKRTVNFESDLYDAVGLMLRDRAFVERAERENLGDLPEVRHEIRLWSEKWVFRELSDRIARNGGSIADTIRALRNRIPVEIDHAVLDSLELSDPRSPGMTLLKGHTMRPAIPVVDAGR